MYHYGLTIKEYRELKKMTQAQLAEVWPKSDGATGVSADYVSLVERGKRFIDDATTLRKLCDLLEIPYWKVGLSEYDPFNQSTTTTQRGSYLYLQTLDTAEHLIKRTWHLRRLASSNVVEESVDQLNRLFGFLQENTPPPLLLEKQYMILYAQVRRLNAVMNVERQHYEEALADFELMYSIGATLDHPVTLALALLGKGTETERLGRQEEAIDLLEEARDTSFRASKNIAALVHAYLARTYASNRQAKQFKRAIDTAEKIARDIHLHYGDGTDFVFHSLSGVMAERSYGYLEIGEPQETLNMKEEIKRQIAVEGNVWLDAWIPLDWARAYVMLGRIEESVKAGLEFYRKAQQLKSPHARSRAYRLLNTIEDTGHRDVQSVRDFRKILDEAVSNEDKALRDVEERYPLLSD
jgi:transcriptional regulator with XRE-family HTH domain